MPTNEELQAQVTALTAQVARLSNPTPTARQLAIVRNLRQRGRITLPVDPSAGYADKRTEFRSLNELRQILNGLEEDLAEALGSGARIRQIRMTTSADKGL